MATPEERLAALEAMVNTMAQREASLVAELQAARATAMAAGQAAEAVSPQRARVVTIDDNNTVVDTRLLGKPDTFNGEEAKWADWKVLFKAYTSVVSPRMAALMHAAESTQDDVGLSALGEPDAATARQLYYILLLLCRQQPLTMVVNAGEGEGAKAWRTLYEHFEPTVRTRTAGLLMNILGFSFTGDVQARIELFEREVLAYERKTGEELSKPAHRGRSPPARGRHAQAALAAKQCPPHRLARVQGGNRGHSPRPGQHWPSAHGNRSPEPEGQRKRGHQGQRRGRRQAVHQLWQAGTPSGRVSLARRRSLQLEG